MTLLLDTHAAIWLTAGDALSDLATVALDEAGDVGGPILISPITAWEVGLLVAKDRLNIPLSPQPWFEQMMQAPYFQLAELTPQILIESSFLPGARFRDPADRILIATARILNLQLITRDDTILDYSATGRVQTIRC